MIHIHIGAGNFGLGFVVPIFKPIATETYILNRSPSGASSPEKRLIQENIRERKFYALSYMDAAETEDDSLIVKINGFIYFNNKNEVNILLDRLGDDKNDILITTSVREVGALNSVCSIINDVANAISDRKLYVICCENGFTTESVKKKYISEYEIDKKIVFIDAIVDRICKDVSYDNIDNPPHVNVYVEKHKLLVLDGNNVDEEFILLMNSVDGINVTKHSSVYRDFKLNVVNAAHIFLAGDAQKYGMPLVNVYLTSEETSDSSAPPVEARRAHLMNIINELACGTLHLAVKRKYPADNEKIDLLKTLLARPHLEEIMNRFSRVEDDVHRILSRLKSPTAEELHTMSDFLRSMLDKVKPPVEGYLDGEEVGPPCVTRSFLNIADLIAARKFVSKFTVH